MVSSAIFGETDDKAGRETEGLSGSGGVERSKVVEGGGRWKAWELFGCLVVGWWLVGGSCLVCW